MRFFKNIVVFLLGTSILWLPIIAIIIAEKLSEVVTTEQLMTIIYILIPILIIKMEFNSAKEGGRKKYASTRTR